MTDYPNDLLDDLVSDMRWASKIADTVIDTETLRKMATAVLDYLYTPLGKPLTEEPTEVGTLVIDVNLKVWERVHGGGWEPIDEGPRPWSEIPGPVWLIREPEPVSRSAVYRFTVECDCGGTASTGTTLNLDAVGDDGVITIDADMALSQQTFQCPDCGAEQITGDFGDIVENGADQ